MSTWGESLKEYERSKRSPLPELDSYRSLRVSSQERLQRERDLNCVTQQFRDPAREEAYSSAKRETLTAKVMQYKEKSSEKFNILTHAGPPKAKVVVNQSIPTRDWNFVSHLPVAQQKQAPIFYNEQFNQSFAYVPKSLSDLSGLAVNAGGRDFNVVSNRFNKSHDEKTSTEAAVLKDKIVDKYWRTHTYDPIRTRYYDPDREVEFLHQSEMVKSVKGLAQMANIAPSIKNAEGFAYNIVTNQVLDEEKLLLSTAIQDRSLSKTIGHKVESDVKQRSDAKDTLDEVRRMNRLNYERYKGPLDLGYNPINNVEYVYEPELKPPVPIWAQLQATSPSAVAGSRSKDLSGQSSSGAVASARSSAKLPSNASHEYRIKSAVDRLEPIHRTLPKDLISFDKTSPLRLMPMSVQSSRTVPSLNLALAQTGPAVTYIEPTSGYAAMPVNIVRTGGF